MRAIIRSQSSGREGGAQGGPRAAVAPSDGAARRVRCLLHLQKHGARADLPRQPAEISQQGPALPHRRAPAQLLHARLLLHPRRGARTDGCAGGFLLPLPDHLLSQRAQLHRRGAQAGGDRFPQARQRLPCRCRSGCAAGGGRPAEPGHYPPAARLLDAPRRPSPRRVGSRTTVRMR